MSRVIYIHAPEEVAQTFIKSFDADEGLVVTSRLSDAKRFATTEEAVTFWRQELPQGVQGFNPARPNRPLTALTVTIMDETNYIEEEVG